MVEFILLFALGFLTAVLLGLILAPAIHSRIVHFTESRLRATMPMSLGELRAARDMERAEYAVRNQSISVDLRKERDRRVEMTQTADRLRETTEKLRGEMAALERRLEEAGEERTALEARAEVSAKIEDALAATERRLIERDRQAANLRKQVRHLSIDIEDLKIDLATRETEMASLKLTIDAMRDEKRRLDAALAEGAANVKDRDYRLSREAERSADLDRRLAAAVARATDREELLERRAAELDRLKERLATATRELGEARSRKPGMEEDRQKIVPFNAGGEDGTMGMNGHLIDGVAVSGVFGADDRNAISRRVEKLRARHSALVERLLDADDGSGDPELREEIKDIAASMVSLTARREGTNSPLRRILAEADGEEELRPTSLAARASSMMREN